MSSSVQAAHSSNHHQFYSISSQHNREQSQELNRVTPGPNRDDHLMNIHPLRQPSATTSRHVSRDSDRIVRHDDDISSLHLKEGMKTPKDLDGKEISNDSSSRPSFTFSDQSSVITPRASCDREQVTAVISASNNTIPLSSSSTKISILGARSSDSNGKNDTDDIVRQAACTSNISSSTKILYSALQPPSLTGTIKDTANVDGTNTGNSNIVDPIAASQSIISPSTIATHNLEDRSPPPDITTTGTKRKMLLNADVSFSPTEVLSQSNTPVSRRDSLPMQLRNKKMRATDCLLFAATLLEQDAAEALVAASTTLITNNNQLSLSNGSMPVTSHAATSFVPFSIPSPAVKKTKPLKKIVCEKIERSSQEVALQKEKKKKQQQQQQRQEDGDCKNKPKDADVLCGRGGKVNKHPGNIVYRKVVEYNKSYYQSVHKKHRILVSQSIVKAILNYGGRFMGQKGKEWTPICFKRAVQKTSQALRERSNSSDAVMQGVVGEYNNRKQFVVEVAEAKM